MNPIKKFRIVIFEVSCFVGNPVALEPSLAFIFPMQRQTILKLWFSKSIFEAIC